jgi:serine/threonine protein kinase
MTARVLSPGDRFADYTIVRLLGAGGFGTVYEAEHALTGRRAALKIAHPHVMEDEDARSRAVQEARALGELQHANVVALQHAGIAGNGQVWIAMELLSGWTLRDLMQSPLPVEQATAILAEACEGSPPPTTSTSSTAT